MKQRRNKVILLILSILLAVGMTGVLIMIDQIDKQSPDNTSEYTATITYTQISGTGENVYIQIFTNEFTCSLQISHDIAMQIDHEKISGMKSGDKICFRIESTYAGQLNEVAFVPIVSLATDDAEILSLQTYNRYMAEIVRPAKITGIVAIILLLGLAAYCCFSLRKQPRVSGSQGAV